MASVLQWTPYGVALDLTVTVASGGVTRISATQYTVKFNVSWSTHWDTETNYGMKASSGGGSIVLNKFGTYSQSGSGSFTGTYSISGNGSAAKSASVTFTNWEEDGHGAQTKAATKSISLSFTVPAWTSYTVSYNANGGSGAPGSQTKWKNQTLTLSATKPTRTGYTFSRWNTASNGSGTSYAAGASFTANANTTLYAIWTANTYAITYDANGGTLGSVKSQTKTYGVNLTLTGTATRANYNFLGWSTNKSATSATYSTGSSFTTNAVTTLYAVWELAYVKPRINSLSADRCTIDGTLSEEGTYVLVKFNWATDWTVTSVIVGYRLTNSTTWSDSIVSASGTSGSVSVIIGGGTISTDHTYDILVTVADGNDSTPATASIGGSLFPIDVLKGGKGVSLFKPAEREGFEVDGASYFNKGATIGGNLYVGGTTVLSTGRYCHYYNPNTANVGYAHLARINILNTYTNPTIKLSLTNRYILTPQDIFIKFNSENNTDPGLNVFATCNDSGSLVSLYLVKSEASTWDLYAYSAAWDAFAITDCQASPYQPSNITWKNEFITSLPSGYSTAGVVSMKRNSVSVLAGNRFTNTWLGFYTNFNDANNATNRRGWIGHDGSTTLYIRNEAGGSVFLLNNASGIGLVVSTDRVRPSGANVLYLGDSTYKWTAVYATNGTIQTSDRNQKTDIKEIDPRYIELFSKLEPVTYRLIGDNHDRVHVGFIAQDVKEAMDELDISPEEFAAYCRDVKMEKIEVVDEETGMKSEKDIPVLDDDGNPIYLYSLRYTEFIALNTRMIQENRKKIADQQTEIDNLKRELAEIKALMKGDANVTSN